MSAREDFSQKTRTLLERGVASHCSNPRCGKVTVGPTADGIGIISLGVAAHITAASPLGPRYESSLTTEERTHAANGIWLCQRCAKLVDSDPREFTVEVLRDWKAKALSAAFAKIAGGTFPPRLTEQALDDNDVALIQRLGVSESLDTVRARLTESSFADVKSFMNEPSWPQHAVPLTLRIGETVTTPSGVAKAIGLTTGMSFVAAPGAGKTTTLLQVTSEILSEGEAVAVFVPLAEWSGRAEPLFQHLLTRQAFRGVPDRHLMLLAVHGQLCILLDGWNELDAGSRRVLIRELSALRRDFPLLRVVISTRRQALDVPIDGPVVTIDGLSESQQLEVARATRGEDGVRLLDRARRTRGLQELIAIPLYLKALLAGSPTSAAVTKEQLLGLFVRQHEKAPDKADTLSLDLFGRQADLLAALAVEANATGNTAISDERARQLLVQAAQRLAAQGQITALPQPAKVLSTLVDQHLLVRSGIDGTISFQHQQFQEWYASFEVERVIFGAKNGVTLRANLREILNKTTWEESLLFCCDRLSSGDMGSREALANAVLEAIGIDPMLAAEMIYRAGDNVWPLIQDRVTTFAHRWHSAGSVDRAVRFMIISARPEFASTLWPLVSGPDRDARAAALRVAPRFRPAVLGSHLESDFRSLPEDVREEVLSELAREGDASGLAQAASLAKADPSPEVQFSVIQSLHFRDAEPFIEEILQGAPGVVWELVAQRFGADIGIPTAAAHLREARLRLIERETALDRKLGLLLGAADIVDNTPTRITDLVGSSAFPVKERDVLVRAHERYPDQVAEGLVRRIEAGLDLPYGAEDMLTSVGMTDSGAIPDLVRDPSSDNKRAVPAAAVVGGVTAGALIDRLIEISAQLPGTDRHVTERLHEEYRTLDARLFGTRRAAFFEAILARAEATDPVRISQLADLLSRYGQHLEAEPPDQRDDLSERIVTAVGAWCEALAADSTATRHQFEKVVGAIKLFPRRGFLPRVAHFLAEDLRMWRKAKEDFTQSRMRGTVTPDVSHSYGLIYRGALVAIGGAESEAILAGYLSDPLFGLDAAAGIYAIWRTANAPEPKNSFRSYPDYSNVASRREERRAGLGQASESAATIFGTVSQILLGNPDEKMQLHALGLASIALALPHGDQSPLIERLLALPVNPTHRLRFLTALVLAGYVISADTVLAGIKALLELAKKEPWRLQEQQTVLDDWLTLLAFSDGPAALLEGLDLSPPSFREPHRIRDAIAALGHAGTPEAERVLLRLAQLNPDLYRDHYWLTAFGGLRAETAERALVALALEGKLGDSMGGYRNLYRKVASIVERYADLRESFFSEYEQLPHGARRAFIRAVIWQLSTPEDVTRLVRAEVSHNTPFNQGLDELIRNVGTEQRVIKGWEGAYEIHGVDLSALRADLFKMTVEKGPAADMAARCLERIDELRDEYGRVDSEPRHPDVASDRPWPPVAHA